MFNLITNVKNRNIVCNISLSELIEQLKNPSVLHKKIVDSARDLGKESKEYEIIKKALPCFVPNYTHLKYIKTETIEKSTGYIYIDVDYEIDLDFEKFTFIAASWKSLSGVGSGLLISLDTSNAIGTDLKSMRAIINDICDTLDIKPDNCAVSRDRLNVIGYDYNAYYNPNHTDYYIKNVQEKVDNKVDIKKNKKLSLRLARDVHFYDGDLRLSNIEDFTSGLEFKDDQLYIDMSETPIEYTEIYIPKTINVGERNKRMFGIVSTVRGLNPTMSVDRLVGFAKHLNSTKCYEPMEKEELLKICYRVFEQKPILFPNKVKKYPFNPIYTLTGRERTNIASSASREKIGKATTDILFEIVKNWNPEIDGKFTMKALSLKSGKSYKTVLRRKDIINLVK